MRIWPRRQSATPRKRLRERRWARVTAAVLVLFLAWFGWSFGHALFQPGGGTMSERVAEWARGHYLGPLVTLAESLTYKAPKVGGKPSFSLAGPSQVPAATPSSGTARHQVRPGFEVPRRLASPAGRPLRGEGQWRVLYEVGGVPAVYATYLRPDRIHTSYVSAIVSMNPHLLRFELRPGAEDPGPGSYGGVQAVIGPGHRRGLAATFNGGFKIASAGGGFWLNGTQRGPLVKGAASMVYYRDGDLRIGVWGRGGLHLARDVEGVRQNLKPIIENGRIPADIDQNTESNWGATIGGAYYVWRSGVGVTRDGRVIFAYGPALDAQTLAGLLRRAGCVMAMELDINPDWTDFMYYKPGHHPNDPTPVALLPDEVQPPSRYYYLTNRDFTAVFAR